MFFFFLESSLLDACVTVFSRVRLTPPFTLFLDSSVAPRAQTWIFQSVYFLGQ